MKQITIIALLLCSIGVSAQTIKPDRTVTVKLTVQQLSTTQILLKYLYDNVKKSTTSAIEAEQVRTSVEQLYPAIVADKPKAAEPKKKP